MNKCFICCNNIDNTNYLPYEDDYIGQNISIFKNTYIIKSIDSLDFIYFLICNQCINEYLKKYGNIFKYVKKRELGIKK